MKEFSLHEVAALVAAALWAFGGMISAEPSRALGAVRFNHLRMWLVFLMLGGWTAMTAGWQGITAQSGVLIAISGFIGIFLGDTALFQTLNRMGPRRTAILFSLNAPMSVILGWFFLHETLSLHDLAGVSLVIVGVFLAIVFGKRKSQLHHWEAVTGSIWAGIALGVVAALCQSVGSLIIRPVMETGIDPIAVSAARVGIAALGLSIIVLFWSKRSGGRKLADNGSESPRNLAFSNEPLSTKIVAVTAFSGFIGMGLGMTLLLYGLSGGKVGIISTLSATTPALILPMLWIKTGEMPAEMAWLGAGLVVLGSWFIFG